MVMTWKTVRNGPWRRRPEKITLLLNLGGEQRSSLCQQRWEEHSRPREQHIQRSCDGNQVDVFVEGSRRGRRDSLLREAGLLGIQWFGQKGQKKHILYHRLFSLFLILKVLFPP